MNQKWGKLATALVAGITTAGFAIACWHLYANMYNHSPPEPQEERHAYELRIRALPNDEHPSFHEETQRQKELLESMQQYR